MTDTHSTLSELVSDTPKPFQDSWEVALIGGWEVFPLPPLSKSPPPSGTTGTEGKILSSEAIRRVCKSQTPFNIGVRPPANVVGIDVDAYGAKKGQETLRKLEAKLGRLPLTYMTTRRWPADPTSGIRWYQLPPGTSSLQWPGILGEGIEVIRHTHRYGVAASSRVHLDDKTGTGPILTYLAIDPQGEVSMEMPKTTDLAQLPALWLDHLDDLSTAPWAPSGQPIEWLTEGDCARVQACIDNFTPGLLNGSRHDAMLSAVGKIARLGARGHGGTSNALEHIKYLFLAATQGESRRDAEDELRRAIEPLGAKLDDEGKETCKGSKCGTVDDLSDLLGVDPLDDQRERRIEAEIARLEISAEARRRFKKLKDEGQAPALFKPATAIMQETYKPGIDLIKGLIPENGVTLLTAERKSGKTTLLMNVARSLLDGVPFLGAFEPRKINGNVALIDLEMTEEMLHGWFGDIGIENLDQLIVMNARGRIATTLGGLEGELDILAAEYRKFEIEVLIIDPLAPLFATMGWGENDNSDVRKAMTLLNEFSCAVGAKELILSHHTGWQNGNTQVRARGASSFEDAPDCLWRLQRSELGTRVFSTMGRLEEIRPTELNWEPETRRLDLGMGLADLDIQAESTRIRNRVEKYMQNDFADSDGWTTASKVSQRFGSADREAAREVILALEIEGKIESRIANNSTQIRYII